MRVMFVIKALHDIKGGAERVFCEIANGLAVRGHDVMAVSFDAAGQSPSYDLDDTVAYCPLGIGNVQEKATLVETRARIRALRAHVRKERPDMVVAFMHSMIVPAAIALRGLGIPLVGSEHIVPAHYRTRPLEYAAFMAAACFTYRITVLSDAIRDAYPWPIRRRMIAVPNPVPMPERPSSEKRVRARSRTILSVGRLDPQKDQATLIEAFSAMAPLYPDWRLRIIGEGLLRATLEELVRARGLSSRVALPGTTSDMAGEYSNAAIFALPSRYESFGMALAEAMAHGLPVIAFADCDGARELISDGENGLLLTGPDRVGALTRAMARLIDDPAFRVSLGVAAAVKAHNYAPPAALDRWEYLLKSVRAERFR